MGKERRGEGTCRGLGGDGLGPPPELAGPRPSSLHGTGRARSGQVTPGEKDLVSQRERGCDGGGLAG